MINSANDKDKDSLLLLARQLGHHPRHMGFCYIHFPCYMEKQSTDLSFREMSAQVQPEEEPNAQQEETNTGQPQVPDDEP
jgi:hypothetical protein